jgi:transcriptional regulator with XRE-family HTH domain
MTNQADTAAQAGRQPDTRLINFHRGGPTVLRMVLGSQLRRLREAAGISANDAGYAIRATHSKISRMELGRVSFRERDVIDLLILYGVTDAQEHAAFSALAREANVPGWWHGSSDVLPSWFEPYLGLEEAASVIRNYQVQFVPGQLQTADYARACVLLGYPTISREELKRRVDLRVHRQELLTRGEGPHFWMVVDEAALRRPLGGVDVMRAQLGHLIEASRLPTVTLQVVPFTAGGHSAAGGPICILRFAEPDLPDIVYLEQLTTALYLDRPEEVDAYQVVMDRLSVQAAPDTETVQILDRIRKDL